MSEPIKISPEEKAEKKRQYMRDYMKKWKAKKYADDAESIRRVNRTRYIKKTKEIDADERTKYGNYLGDVLRLKVLISNIPSQFVLEIMKNENIGGPWEG